MLKGTAITRSAARLQDASQLAQLVERSGFVVLDDAEGQDGVGRGVGERDVAQVRADHRQPRIDRPCHAAGVVADLEADAAVAAAAEVDGPLGGAAAGVDDQPLTRQMAQHHVVDELDGAVLGGRVVAADPPGSLAPLDRVERVPEIDLVGHCGARAAPKLPAPAVYCPAPSGLSTAGGQDRGGTSSGAAISSIRRVPGPSAMPASSW